MPSYFAIIEGSAGAYGAIVPDLPGCTAMGETPAAALRHAAKAARDWLADARRAGETPPAARSIEMLQADREIRDTLLAGATIAEVPALP